MLQKTTTFATLGVLVTGAAASLAHGDHGRPLTSAREAGVAMELIERGIETRVSGRLTASEDERWFAAPGGAAPVAPASLPVPVRVAIDDGLRPALGDALRALGQGRLSEDDSPRGDPILRLLNGRVDAAFSAREPGPGERRRGVAEERLGDLVLAFVAHPDNPVGSLHRDQVRQVLRGEIGDWARLGGTPGPIHLVLPPNGAEGDLYARVLMRGDPLPSHGKTAATDAARLRIVQQDPAALTVVALEAAGAASAAVLRIDGVAPGAGMFRLGRYPFGSPIVFVHRGGAAATGLLGVLRGSAAQDLLASHIGVQGR